MLSAQYLALSDLREDAARRACSRVIVRSSDLFGANFIIAFIYILFIINFICTAPIQSAVGASTAPGVRAGIGFCFHSPPEQRDQPEPKLPAIGCIHSLGGFFLSFPESLTLRPFGNFII
jgi:hypothetical protein